MGLRRDALVATKPLPLKGRKAMDVRDGIAAGVESPFVSTGRLPSPALVRQLVDEAYERYRREELRRLVGVNATGLPFNSLAAVEQSGDGRTNSMVNPGAIAVTSLVPGADMEQKWHFIQDGLSRFAGRQLALDDEVYRSASETNHRNQSLARLLQR